MQLQSKFKFWVFFPVILFLLATGFLALIAKELLVTHSMPLFATFLFLFILVFVWVWVVFGELRTKVIILRIDGDDLVVSNFLGLGSKKKYSLSRFDGFETAMLLSRYDSYEYLYLMENDRKVVKLSQFYHRNYSDLKNAISSKVLNLGKKEFSFIDEIKEIFT